MQSICRSLISGSDADAPPFVESLAETPSPAVSAAVVRTESEPEPGHEGTGGFAGAVLPREPEDIERSAARTAGIFRADIAGSFLEKPASIS